MVPGKISPRIIWVPISHPAEMIVHGEIRETFVSQRALLCGVPAVLVKMVTDRADIQKRCCMLHVF